MSNENPYIITYSNWLEFNGRKLAFRKKELFDITDGIPKHIPFVGHWNVGRQQLSKLQASKLYKEEPVNVDVSDLQWYRQEMLNHVFNL